LTSGSHEVLLAKKSGKAIRFNESTVRSMGRTAAGVRGVRLENENDEVIGMVCVLSEDEESIMVVSEKGYGKRTSLDDYRITGRGGKGVKTLQITDKTGGLVSIKSVTDEDELMIINKSGIAIRLPLSGVRIMGRATQGVRLIKLREKDEIASVAKVRTDEEEEDELLEGAEGAEGAEVSESTETNNSAEDASEEEDGEESSDKVDNND